MCDAWAWQMNALRMKTQLNAVRFSRTMQKWNNLYDRCCASTRDSIEYTLQSGRFNLSKENGENLNGIRTDCDGARAFFAYETHREWSDFPLQSEQKLHNSEHIETTKCFVLLLLFCLFFFSSVLVCVLLPSKIQNEKWNRNKVNRKIVCPIQSGCFFFFPVKYFNISLNLLLCCIFHQNKNIYILGFLQFFFPHEQENSFSPAWGFLHIFFFLFL